MNRTFATILIGLSAVAVAQQARLAFQAKDGSMKLGPIGTFILRQKGTTLSFTGKGDGLTGSWKDLEIRASTISGTAEKAGAGYDLRTADATGGVTTTFTKGSGSFVCTSSALAYRSGQTQDDVKLTGAVTVVNTDPAIQRTLEMRGTSADLVVLGAQKQLSSATVGGPVKLTLRQAARLGKAATKIDASGDRMTYKAGTGKTGTMILTGNVKMSGEGDTFSGDGEAAQAIVEFDASGLVDSVELSGTPTVTRLNPKKGGGQA
jgi:hypothetical protein